MKQIDIKDFPGLKEAIEDNIVNNEVIFTENGVMKYVLVDIDEYEDGLNSIYTNEPLNFFKGGQLAVKVMDQSGEDIDLSIDEYEELKEKIIEALEAQLKPDTKFN